MGLISKSPNVSPASVGLKSYTDAEKATLSKLYTPEQIRAVEAGEEAIDLGDVLQQGRARTDPYVLKYLDDLSQVKPILDKRIREKSTIPANAKWLDQEEVAEDIAEWMAREWHEYENNASMSLPDNFDDMTPEQVDAMKPNRLDFLKYMEEATSMTGGGKRGTSVLAPTLGKIPSVEAMHQKSEVERDNEKYDPDGKYTAVLKQTGLRIKEVRELKMKVLVRHRVVNQTRLGKISSMYVLAIAGDGQGSLGIGEGKNQEPEDAIDMARRAAIRNMKPIPRYEERTIFGDIEGKVAGSEVRLMARPPGFGLRCHHNIFEMCRAAGISDLAARVDRSRNKMNTIKAAYQALLGQRLPDEIARGRGKKLVDVRKVYYGGEQRLPQYRESEAAL
ncbi:MAG: 28S ribosomal protein S5, mitochondrial [Claussenomyces sp. TS43310]|nr:MAG: 28S ribosomal protein S5, mitochondrial [Claussenomyces sp. TS43310]